MCDACGGRSWEQVLERFRALRDEHGWALVQVEPDDPGHPGFTYTVGLHQFDGHPELLVSGDEPDVAQALKDMGAQVREGGASRPVTSSRTARATRLRWPMWSTRDGSPSPRT